MTKTSSALMSLVAAVPGAILAFLLVMAFLNHADKMGGALNAVAGVALLCGVATALMPVGIIMFAGPKGPARVKPPKTPKSKKQAVAEEAAPDETVVGLEEDADEGTAEFESEMDSGSAVSDESGDSDESGISDDFASSESEDLLDVDDEAVGKQAPADEWDASDTDLSDEFEFDDDLSDDELEFDFDDENK